MSTHTRAMTRFASVTFSTANYRRLLKGQEVPQLADAVANLHEMLGLGAASTNENVVDATWRWLLENRRDDSALRSLFLSRSTHNPFAIKGSQFAFELRLGAATADFACLTPGYEEVVEIKSIVDSASRLNTQVGAYRRVFPRVSLVGDANDVDRITKLSERHETGALLLEQQRGASRLIRHRDAPVVTESLSIPALVRVLQLGEVEHVVKELTGESLRAQRVNAYSAARTMLTEFGVKPQELLPVVMSHLSQRRRLSAAVVERSVHPALRSVVATIDPPREQLSVLHDWLASEV